MDISFVTDAAGGDASDIGAFESSPFPLVFTEVRKLGTDIRLGFLTEAGWNYAVQYRTNAESGIWSVFTKNGPGITGSTTVSNSGVAGLPRRFYRAQLRQ